VSHKILTKNNLQITLIQSLIQNNHPAGIRIKLFFPRETAGRQKKE